MSVRPSVCQLDRTGPDWLFVCLSVRPSGLVCVCPLSACTLNIARTRTRLVDSLQAFSFVVSIFALCSPKHLAYSPALAQTPKRKMEANCQNEISNLQPESNSPSGDESPDDEERKLLMSTDVEEKTAVYVATHGDTPGKFKNKGNRAVSLPPPSKGRSGSSTSLYFGGDASAWWSPWYLQQWHMPSQ